MWDFINTIKLDISTKIIAGVAAIVLASILICAANFFYSFVFSALSKLKKRIVEQRKHGAKEREYAVKIALQLEAYIDWCVDTANIEVCDRLASNMVEVFNPKKVCSKDYLESYMDYRLISRIHALERKNQKTFSRVVDFSNSGSMPIDRIYFFEVTRLEFAEFGLNACNILKNWKEIYEIPHEIQNDEEPEIVLRRRIAEAERREQKRIDELAGKTQIEESWEMFLRHSIDV